MSLLIDADFIVYKCCAAAEEDFDFGVDVIVVTSRFSDVMRLIERDLNNVKSNLGLFDDIILFFSSATNFRKEIAADYKGHRNRKKPCGYRRAIDELSKTYEVIKIDDLEADDALGIYATENPGNIICSPDKDLRQIPGKLYDFKNETITITPEEGERWFFIQTMSGDMTDGYSGIPGIGVKRAAALLDKNGCTWETVVNAFAEKNMTEEDALMNARLARILTKELYKDGRVIKWDSTYASNATDNRAGIQSTSAV